MEIPQLSSRDRITPKALVLAVFAPFGSDPVLSQFPDGVKRGVSDHPLVRHLMAVAATGVDVLAWVDLFDDSTWSVEIRSAAPATVVTTNLGKQNMDEPASLSGLLAAAATLAPESDVVLAMEGHGAGFLPDLDRRLLTMENVALGGQVAWRVGGAQLVNTPLLDDGRPFLEQGAPVLPMGNPTSPTNHQALSTFAVGEALGIAQSGAARRVSVLHFNNCFNMSVELLHTVLPYAEVATGYCNYNFFTAGEAYPAVFARLAKQGSATPEELGRWFAEENHRVLLENGHEPTVGCTVQLSRMRDIVEKVDDLSDALLAALRTVPAAERPVIVDRIGAAIHRAQQYDSRPDFKLDTPDELTDLDSLATELLKEDFGPFKVHAAADALRSALSGIKVYGDKGTPWMSPSSVWDFTSKNLAMNIFLPDPMRRGLWDWRSQYYLDVNPDPTKPQVQPHIIDFVKVTDWVDFLIEYHRDTPFVGLLPAAIPEFPVKSLRGEPPPCTRHGHRHHRDDHDADDRKPGARAN